MALLVILFIVVPILELYVIIQVGGWIGVWPTLALLLGDALLGSFLLRHQGRSAWLRFNEALDQRRFPSREVADGAMIIVGGTLLLTPGFITDIFGLLLLIPPTRAVIRGISARLLGRRFKIVHSAGAWGYERARGGPQPPGPPPPGPEPYDVEGHAEEVNPNGASGSQQLDRGDRPS